MSCQLHVLLLLRILYHTTNNYSKAVCIGTSEVIKYIVYQTIEYENIFFQIKIFSILWAKLGSLVFYRRVRPYTTCGWKKSRSSRRTSPSSSPPPWTYSEASSMTTGTHVLVLLTIVVQLSKYYLISNKHSFQFCGLFSCRLTLGL